MVQDLKCVGRKKGFGVRGVLSSLYIVSLLLQVPVVLRFTCANLQKSPSIVYVSGSMTDWKSVEMARCKGEKDFNLILDCSPGKYFYKFFVNNEWCVDESQTISSYMTRKPSGTKGRVINIILGCKSNTDVEISA